MQQDISGKSRGLKNWIWLNAGICATVWAAIIFILCAMPGEYIPSNDWLELLSIDKLVHASIFFVLTSLLLLFSIRKFESKKIFLTLSFFAPVVYGILLELMQATYFRNRSADLKDMIANTFGCAIAVFFFGKLKQWVKEIKLQGGNSI